MLFMQWFSSLNPVTQIVFVLAFAWVLVTLVKKIPSP